MTFLDFFWKNWRALLNILHLTRQVVQDGSQAAKDAEADAAAVMGLFSAAEDHHTVASAGAPVSRAADADQIEVAAALLKKYGPNRTEG